jgi:hypothetical protein
MDMNKTREVKHLRKSKRSIHRKAGKDESAAGINLLQIWKIYI